MTDRLGLPALFSADARIGTRCVDEGKDRHGELLGCLHQAERFAIAFRTAHSEITERSFARITAFLMSDHHNRLTVKTSHAADNRRIIRVSTITVQFMEVRKNHVDVIQCVRTIRMASQKRHFPRRKLIEDFFEKFGFFLFKPVDVAR